VKVAAGGIVGWLGKGLTGRWTRAGLRRELAKSLLDEVKDIRVVPSGETEVQVSAFQSTVFDRRYDDCVKAFPLALVRDLGRFYEDVGSAWTQRTQNRVGWSYLQGSLRDAPKRKDALVEALTKLSGRGRLRGFFS